MITAVKGLGGKKYWGLCAFSIQSLFSVLLAVLTQKTLDVKNAKALSDSLYISHGTSRGVSCRDPARDEDRLAPEQIQLFLSPPAQRGTSYMYIHINYLIYPKRNRFYIFRSNN